jgi:hypothetical protein
MVGGYGRETWGGGGYGMEGNGEVWQMMSIMAVSWSRFCGPCRYIQVRIFQVFEFLCVV